MFIRNSNPQIATKYSTPCFGVLELGFEVLELVSCAGSGDDGFADDEFDGAGDGELGISLR